MQQWIMHRDKARPEVISCILEAKPQDCTEGEVGLFVCLPTCTPVTMNACCEIPDITSSTSK